MLSTSCASPKGSSWFDSISYCAAWNSIFLLSGVAEFSFANTIWISGGMCHMDVFFCMLNPEMVLISVHLMYLHENCSCSLLLWQTTYITPEYRSLMLFWWLLSYLCLCLLPLLWYLWSKSNGSCTMSLVMKLKCVKAYTWNIINCNPGIWQELRLDTSTLVWLLNWLFHYIQWPGFGKLLLLLNQRETSFKLNCGPT